MIISIIVYRCPHCNSEEIGKNGHDYKGTQKYHCHRCKRYGTLNASKGYGEKEKELILRTYQERASMRGVERIFGTARQHAGALDKGKGGQVARTGGHFVGCSTRRPAGTGRIMVICAHKAQPTLALDCSLSAHPTGGCLLCRRPQRRQLPRAAPTHPPKLSRLLLLQRLVGGVSTGL